MCFRSHMKRADETSEFSLDRRRCRRRTDSRDGSNRRQKHRAERVAHTP